MIMKPKFLSCLSFFLQPVPLLPNRQQRLIYFLFGFSVLALRFHVSPVPAVSSSHLLQSSCLVLSLLGLLVLYFFPLLASFPYLDSPSLFLSFSCTQVALHFLKQSCRCSSLGFYLRIPRRTNSWLRCSSCISHKSMCLRACALPGEDLSIPAFYS